MTLKFRNPFDRKTLEHPAAVSGEMTRPVYKWRLNDEGEQVRKFIELDPVYEKIQAERDAVDLQAILRRYESGDATALDKVQGMYIDTYDLPKNYADLYKAVEIHNQSFESMPALVKEKFDNSPAKFWSQFGTERFDEVIREYREEVLSNYGLVDENPIVTVKGDIDGEWPEVKEKKGEIPTTKTEEGE